MQFLASKQKKSIWDDFQTYFLSVCLFKSILKHVSVCFLSVCLVSYGRLRMDCVLSFLPVCVHLIIFWKVLVSSFCSSLCHIICLMPVLIFLSVCLSFFRLILSVFFFLFVCLFIFYLFKVKISWYDLIWRLFIVFDFLF